MASWVGNLLPPAPRLPIIPTENGDAERSLHDDWEFSSLWGGVQTPRSSLVRRKYKALCMKELGRRVMGFDNLLWRQMTE
jgi:hypothetical protein